MTSDDCGTGTGFIPAAHEHGTHYAPAHATPIEVEVEALGPGEDEIERAREALARHPRLSALLGDSDHRVLNFRLTDGPTEPRSERVSRSAKTAAGCPLDRFVATIYDYSENRVIGATGPLHALDPDAPDHIDLQVLGHQPLPSGDEFAAAVAAVMRHRELREELRSERMGVYRPMPPVLLHEQPDGRVERMLTVGLRSLDPADPAHEIVAVRMFDHQVLRGLDDVPAHGRRVCEPPPSRDPNVSGGGATGQCWITIVSGGQTLWRFLAIRPGASSGTNGSGIELRDVSYRGKRVLYQAHVPILNVEYGGDGQEIGCGPTYRDWQNAETRFEANGAAVAPGFVLCPQPARTIIDSNSDQGNFTGVAIFVDGPEVVLVSEMQAGWYRYVTEWLRNTLTNEAYEIVPGPNDGVATPYGGGDLWVLRYHAGEIDDGQGFSTDANLSRAHLEKFMTPPESVVDTDVVVWYAAHYVHDAGVEVGNWVGPDLVPVGW